MDRLKPGLQYIKNKEIYLQDIKSIVLAGDAGCTGFNETSKRVLARILEIKADLFIILGDLVRDGKPEEFKEIIDFYNKRVSVPIFTLCGNHDLPAYSKFFGLTSYAIVLNRIIIVVLHNATGSFKKEDLCFLESTLKKHKEKKFLVLFHIPPPTDLDSSCMKKKEWFELKNRLDKYKERIEIIFSAHIHGFEEYHLDDYHIFITGGGGARLCNSEKDNLKSHHAIRINLKNENSNLVDFDIIPIR